MRTKAEGFTRVAADLVSGVNSYTVIRPARRDYSRYSPEISAEKIHFAPPLAAGNLLLEYRRADHCYAAVPAPAKWLPLAERDAALGEIVWREFDPDFIAGDNADEMLTHPAGDVGGHNVPPLDFNAKSSIC